MYLLGSHLPDHKLVRIALTTFYGISYAISSRLCARLQLHERATVASLSESQVAELSAYLSSPASIPSRSPNPTSSILPSPNSILSSSSSSSTSRVKSKPDYTLPPSQRSSPSNDPLRSLVLESDLRRSMQANIAHHRIVGSYKGRRHAGGLPVRGQRTRRNAQTARKLNRVERRQFGTFAQNSSPSSSLPSLSDSRALSSISFHPRMHSAPPRPSPLSLSGLLTPLARLRFSA